MSLENALANLANSANVLATAITVNATAITSINAASYSVSTNVVANTSGIFTIGVPIVSGNGLYSNSTFNGTYGDGIVVDYVTGNGRISVGAADSLSFYTNNVAGNLMLQMSATGTIVNGSINAASHTVGTSFTANSTMTNTASLVVSTNTATIGTGTYFVSNGNVGIGNSVPTTALSVTGDISYSGNLNFLTNNKYLNFKTTNGNTVNFVQQNDDNFVMYSTNTAGGARPIWSVYANSITSVLNVSVDTTLNNLNLNAGYGSATAVYGCRAWASYNGQTPVLNGSGGISSVTKGSAGNYTFNLSVTMPDTKYAVTFSMGDISGVGNEHAIITPQSTSAFLVQTSLSGDSWADAAGVYISVFR